MRRRLLPILAMVILLGAESLSTSRRAFSAASRASSQISAFVQPGAGPGPVLKLINNAHKSIRLEVYLLDQSSIVSALANARRRGVAVRTMLEEHPYGAEKYASLGYSMLKQAKINVRWANEGSFTYTHEKAIVIDNKVSGIFTFNLTGSGLYDNREFGVVDRNPIDAHKLAGVFDADWSHRSLHFSSTRLVVSPYNARSDLSGEINHARHTLDLYEEEMADSSIEGRLVAAKHRGVRVRVLTSADSAGVATLRGNGIAVEVMGSPYVHAKAIVADGHEVFVGSENISATSLDRNREVGILLNNRKLASIVEKTFALDWAAHRPAGTATPPPVSGGLKLSVSATPASVRKGQELTISAHTASGAGCVIRVTYPDGYVSRASALAGTKIAVRGYASWSWHVGSTAIGTSHAEVTCALGGKSSNASTTFTIT